jgi:hypothetical protein
VLILSRYRDFTKFLDSIGKLLHLRYLDISNTGIKAQLEELYIKDCTELRKGLPVHLPSLAKLETRNCPQLVFSLPRASSQYKMILQNCNTAILLNESPIGIQKLEIQQFDALEFVVQSCQCKLILDFGRL